MAGTRWDKIKIDDRTTLLRLTDTIINTWIVGGVYNFNPAFGVYANTAKSLAGQGGFSPTPANEYLPPGIGRAREAGLKLDLWNRRVSGSIAYYENEAGSEAVNIPLPERNVVDAPGINGRNGGNFLPIYVKSKGLEASLSFRLTPNWRMQLNAGTNNGRIIGDRELPIYYNDQFYSDGTTVRISSNSGPALMVPASPADPRGALRRNASPLWSGLRLPAAASSQRSARRPLPAGRQVRSRLPKLRAHEAPKPRRLVQHGVVQIHGRPRR